MRSILSSETHLHRLPVVLEIKEKLKDLPDCVITATAIVYSDLMLTEAEDIPKAVNFEVLNLEKFAEEYLRE